ncbi:MAG: GIY-YIG nuclease family protein [Saprospiraceae bacterium]|nr:GIY-YIG nuclease family protein [Saprospiraceae bacterium]
MPSTYILYSASLDRYYIGSTDKSVEERLAKHLTNHDGFTAKAKDWEVVYCKIHDTIAEARFQESSIKRSKSRKVIQALIRDYEASKSG